MSSKEVPYNPLEKKHLAESIAAAILERPAVVLSSLEPFEGSGIYAIYYSGDTYHPYAAIARLNTQGLRWPIYVGKAIPSGGRKGNYLDSPPAGLSLFKRIIEHRDSIEAAENLRVADFHCRYLVTDDIWIPLGESLLIDRFRPLWNIVVDGFGNHDPGSGRSKQKKSAWDVLHPGRAWTKKLTGGVKRSEEQILTAIEESINTYLATLPPDRNEPPMIEPT